MDQIDRLIQSMAEQRRKAIDNVNGNLTTVHSVDGKFLVDGAGEALQTVTFPVKFVERPNFVTGGELHPGSIATRGSFPTMSAVILVWTLNPSDGSNLAKEYFIGATLIIVTTGPVGQRMWIHWRATGRALANPAGDAAVAANSFI